MEKLFSSPIKTGMPKAVCGLRFLYLFTREYEMLKTLFDCARYPAFKICDRYDIDGEWHHKQGIDPCIVVGYTDTGMVFKSEGVVDA